MGKELSLLEFLKEAEMEHGANAPVGKVFDSISEAFKAAAYQHYVKNWTKPENVMGRDIMPVAPLSDKGHVNPPYRLTDMGKFWDRYFEENKIRTVSDLRKMIEKNESRLVDWQDNHGKGLLRNMPNPYVQGGEQTTFRKYPDEPLSPRISAVRMESHRPESREGNLYVTIDGKEQVFDISGHTFEGYKNGAVPLNVLANVCMKKHDEQQAILSSMVDLELERSRDQHADQQVKR